LDLAPQPPPPAPPPPPPSATASLLAQRLAAYEKSGLLSGVAGADVHVLPSSSELGTSGAVMPAAPYAAPAAVTTSSMKALEVHGGLEGGVANGAYAPSLGSLYRPTASPGYYDDLAAVSPPPPMVLVKEVVTTVTTTYPSGSRIPSHTSVAHSTEDKYGSFSPYESTN
jgi:hypothetical protein